MLLYYIGDIIMNINYCCIIRNIRLLLRSDSSNIKRKEGIGRNELT